MKVCSAVYLSNKNIQFVSGNTGLSIFCCFSSFLANSISSLMPSFLTTIALINGKRRSEMLETCEHSSFPLAHSPRLLTIFLLLSFFILRIFPAFYFKISFNAIMQGAGRVLPVLRTGRLPSTILVRPTLTKVHPHSSFLPAAKKFTFL
jgi:hypothetical protein